LQVVAVVEWVAQVDLGLVATKELEEQEELVNTHQ
jgi:hypothetical protein